VVIVTDHDAIGWELVGRAASSVFDRRNALRASRLQTIPTNSETAL